jgi:N4-(beta-N-acetylglucosaminyl)-L-asparaginase
MRRGRHPKDAGMEALKRIKDNTIEKRLLTAKGTPDFGINFYILNAKGEYAGVTMYELEGRNEPSYAVCTENGAQIIRSEPLIKGNLRETT